MAVWRVGMPCVCITDRYEKAAGENPFWPVLRGVYRVAGIDGDYLELQEDPEAFDPEWGWAIEDFRPLIDQADDTALIARIKNCTPQRVVAHGDVGAVA